MENVIYNELRMRGYRVDVGVVPIAENDRDGKVTRKQPELLYNPSGIGCTERYADGGIWHEYDTSYCGAKPGDFGYPKQYGRTWRILRKTAGSGKV